MTSVYLGELIPVCLCAIAAAAYFAREQRWMLTGALAAVSLAEPHIGAPVCLSVLVWLPRARLSLGVIAAGLAAASIFVLGPLANIEYVSTVLPAHALSELSSDAQLSMSVVVHALGFSSDAALRVGTLSFIAFATAGCIIAGALARKLGDYAFVVAVPAAFSVIGGVFIHVTDVAVAIPLVLLLLERNSAYRPVLVAALVLLSVPWWSLATPMLLGAMAGFAFASITATFLLWTYSARALTVFIGGVAAFALSMVVVLWYATSSDAITPIHFVTTSINPRYPEASWAIENARYLSTNAIPAWLLRIPTWTGLLLTAFICSVLFGKHIRVAEVPI
jgi:hypothetical protein